jgi:ACT domain-containing protein
MEIRKALGRKPKVTYTTMLRLEDAIQHNSSISEACRWTGISRTIFFYYMRNSAVFREKMLAAKDNQNKVVFSFFTLT